MPPRKRPPPPPPAADVKPNVKPKPSPPPQPPTPSPPAPIPAAPSPSPTILAALQEHDREVYLLVFAAGNKGMWSADLKAATHRPAALITKSLKLLIARRLLKEVSSVHHRAKKMFMAVEFEPSPEITGGTWYLDGALDSDAVAAARRRCLAQIDALGAATVDMIYHGIKKSDPRAEYTLAQVKEIVETMALDRVVEEVRSSGDAEFGAVKAGRVCYRRGGAPVGGMMEGIPCGVCPRIAECSPDGVISPRTCVYYNKWLQMDF